MSAVSLTLPFPPSVNNLFLNVQGRGRVKTKAYKAWLTEAAWAARSQHAGRVEGAYSLTIKACLPDKRRRDLGNLLKAVEDFLVAHGVVEDDSLVQRLEMSWSGPGKTISVNVLSTREVMP